VPYLLKEHRNRWYVIAWNEEQEGYRTYALDRIDALRVIAETQPTRADFQADEFCRHATGIMESKAKPGVVELNIADPISRLVLLEPLHATQQVLKQDKDSMVIQLKVLVNEEFTLKLLGFGAWCTVNKPASLRALMKEMVGKMMRNYT